MNGNRLASAMVLLVLSTPTNDGRATLAAQPPAEPGACAAEAILVKVDEDTRRTLAYAGRFAIDVEFASGVALTADQIEDANTFELVVAASGKGVDVRRATWRGFVADSVNGEPAYGLASLWGDFVPDAGYLLTARCPDGGTDHLSVSVQSGATPPPKLSFLAHFLDRTLLTFEAARMEGTDEVGFDYQLQFALATWGRSRTLRLALESNGVFSTDPEDLQIQSALTVGLPLDIRFHPRIGLSYGGVKREFTYPMGFRLKAAELEANQTFKVVNYTAKAQLAATIPAILDLPVLWLNGATGVNRPFFPPLVVTGFTFVDDIEGEAANGGENRWDIQAIWRFPLATDIDVRTDWRGYIPLGDGEFKNYLDVGVIYYFGDGQDRGVEIGYQTGSLPPEFKGTSAMSLGFKIDTF